MKCQVTGLAHPGDGSATNVRGGPPRAFPRGPAGGIGGRQAAQGAGRRHRGLAGGTGGPDPSAREAPPTCRQWLGVAAADRAAFTPHRVDVIPVIPNPARRFVCFAA